MYTGSILLLILIPPYYTSTTMSHSPLLQFFITCVCLFLCPLASIGQDDNSVHLGHRLDYAYRLVDRSADSAIKIAAEVQLLSQQEGLLKYEADALYIKALAYWYQGRAESSLICHEQALKIRENLRDSIGIGRSLNNIGLIAQEAGQDSLALSFFQRSFAIRKAANQHTEMIYSATNICDQLDRMGQHDSAQALMTEVKLWAQRSQSTVALAFVTEHIGITEEQRGNYAAALANYLLAFNLREDSLNNRTRTRGLLQLSRCMAVLDSTELDIPIQYALEGIASAKANQWTDLESQAHLQLSGLYRKMGDIEMAYQHLSHHRRVQEIVEESESFLRIQALQAIQTDILKRAQLASDNERRRSSSLRQWIERLGIILAIGILLGIGLYVRYRNIKKQRNLLDQEKKQVEEKNQKLESFSSMVSHDIKEPIRSFTYFLALLRRHGVGGPGSELELEYEEAQKRIADLSSMLEDLEIYFGLTGGKMKWEHTDIGEIAHKVSHDLKRKITRSNAEVRVDSLPVLETYPTLIYQILLNLVSNALRFQQENTQPLIRISGKIEDDQFFLSVMDNGIGIPPEHLGGIFKAFNRGNRHEFRGSGLGLAIVAKAVDLLHGSVTVASEPGSGSEFTISLPVVSQSNQEDIVATSPESVTV